MRYQWLAYGIVALLSVVAGVAVAGVPGTGSADPTIVVPASTDPPPTTITPTTEPAPPVTDVAATTTTTDETTTTVPESTTTEAAATSTTAPEPVLPERSALDVVVANGANIGGIASATSQDLEDAGYVDVRATDGTDIVFFTIVYYEEGFQGSAERLADDLGLPATSTGPMSDAPDVIGGLDGEVLLVYLGSDQRADEI